MGQYHYSAANPGLELHQHRGCLEISFLIKGYQAFQVGGKVYHVRGGEQYISLPDELHDTAGQPEEKGILYWLILDVTQDRDRFLYLNPAISKKVIRDLHHLPSRHFVSHPESQATLVKAFLALKKISSPSECAGFFKEEFAKSPIVSKEEMLAGKLAVVGHILAYLSQTIQASRAKPPQPSPVIQSSLDYIARHNDEWFTVSQIAEKLRITEAHFRSTFRKEMGLPPSEYMLRLKIEVAKKRLSRPKSNITEVAHGLGFSSSQYFATVFRRFTNRTPSEFLEGRDPQLERIIECT